MKRQQINQETYADYIAHEYRDSKQNQVFAHAAHMLLGQIYRPRISFSDEKATRTDLRYRIANKELISVGSNHLTNKDQFVIVSVAQRVKELHPLRGKTNIPAKSDIANNYPRLVRWGAENLGAKWVDRQKDQTNRGIEVTSELRSQHKRNLELAESADVYRMVYEGVHSAGFLEGRRNEEDFRVVQPLKIGIARTLQRVAKEVPVTFLPMAICYDNEQANYKDKDRSLAHPLAPNVHLGTPIEVDPEATPDELNQIFRPALQYCNDRAIEAYELRTAA